MTVSVLNLDVSRVRVRRSFAKPKIFFLDNTQHVRSKEILSECLTLGATLLSMLLWGAVLLVLAT